MKRFIIKSLLFILPLAAIVLPSYHYLSSHGELESFEAMVEKNQKDGTLIGLSYSDPAYLLKQRVLERRKPNVISLGTSRVLQLRDFFFKEPDRYYNCGRCVRRMKDYNAFLNSYPAELPELIVLGLDQDLFNKNFDDLTHAERNYVQNDLSREGKFFKNSKALIKSFKKGKIDRGEVKKEDGFGVNARLHHTGFRADGSYRYGNYIGEQLIYDDYKFGSTIGRIAKNKRRFSASDEVNPEALEEFANFLKNCKEKGIHVVVFLPPYAETVLMKMAEQPAKYPNMFELYDKVLPICSQLGYPLFDLTQMSSFGSNDFEAIDGLHGSEVCYLRGLRLMAQSDERLATHVDVAHLDSLLKSAFSSRQVVKEIDELNAKPVIELVE